MSIDIVHNITFPCLNSFIDNNYKEKIVLQGLLNPFDLFLIEKIIKNNKKILYITTDEQTSLKAQKDIENLLNLNSFIYPFQEIDLYSNIEKNLYIYQEQVNILLNKPNIVFMPVKSLFEKMPDIDFYKQNCIEFHKNENIDYSSLINKLILFGYKRVTTVSDIGEFALRGDILDIYSLNENPYRVEFFADTIEDIRYFNPATQKSFENIEKAKIFPLYKFILDENVKKSFKNEINSIEIKKDDEFRIKIKNELLEKIDEIGYFEGIEYYINYLSKNQNAILDYFKDYIVVFKETSQLSAKYISLEDNYNSNYNDAINSNFKLPLKTLNHVTYKELMLKLKNFKRLALDNFVSDDFDKIIEFDLSLPPIFSSDVNAISKFIKKNIKDGYKIYICTNFPNRLKEIFKEFQIFSDDIFYLPDISCGGSISFDKKISEDKILILTDKEIFNKHSRDITVKKYYSNKQTQDYIDSINDIKIGEYVVHDVHGIGLYNGITKQVLDDNEKDYLEIQFAGSDKLFMPAEQINLLCRYRGSNVVPKLSKMGGTAWENIKSKAKKEVELIAYDLLDLYAKRKLTPGIEFHKDTPWQNEMEDNFEFTETQDQMKAINEVKIDMEQSKPMDRLICADVGFGKTEIALRAMFKAVMSGYQTALIAPTTILTMQHFETIKERFAPFNVEIGILNRFLSKKNQNDLIKKINDGQIDVVIATHRLLSDDIKFKKLGLLVIDEEHKFGVQHKEKLKKIKENIDVLSLSATPIPRTLNMALSGIKDLSVINTPPKNRLPIKTYVGEFSKTYIKNAINQEIQREGQIYYLYNRVETINSFKKQLEEIVPNARIEIAHGKMPKNQLEDVICKFLNKEFDILLTTTIVESGLDIPNANTMIIHDADNFGLAQLYQLRGRVGRSDRQAYCFCFYKKSKQLNEQALKRLESIKDFTTLGSGYKIALRDIEIRGVGNILGTSQHGQMVSVGFDTYCNLLAECIEDIKNRQNKKNSSDKIFAKNKPTIIDIHTSAYIPDDWAQTYEQKILEYKRLSDVETISELENMELNFKDRFSKIPECVENLIKLIKLRIIATNAGIIAVRQNGNQIRINMPYTINEWMILKSQINNAITRYFTFSHPLKNQSKIKGILLMNKNEDNFDEIFNKLSNLFYDMSKVILNYKNKN